MRTKTIRIVWSIPQPIGTVIDSLNGDEIGLYYITRTYNGKEKSLYIGESISSIKSRLLDHNKNWVHNYSHSKIYVRIGKIVYPRQNIENAIQHAEKALIFEHGQYGTKVLFENTVSTKTYTYDDIYKIINEGDRFELKSEVDMNCHEDIQNSGRVRFSHKQKIFVGQPISYRCFILFCCKYSVYYDRIFVARRDIYG